MRATLNVLHGNTSREMLLRLAQFALARENNPKARRLEINVLKNARAAFNFTYYVNIDSVRIDFRFRNEPFPATGISYAGNNGAVVLMDLPEALVYAIAWTTVTARLRRSNRRPSVRRYEANERAEKVLAAFRAQKPEFFAQITAERTAATEREQNLEARKQLVEAFRNSPSERLKRLDAQEKRLLSKQKRIQHALAKIHRSRAQIQRQIA